MVVTQSKSRAFADVHPSASTFSTSRFAVAPTVGDSGDGIFRAAYAGIRERWEAMGIPLPAAEEEKAHLSLLASPCGKGTVVAAVEQALSARLAETETPSGETYRLFVEDALRTSHPANRGWVVLAVAQAAYGAGERQSVPELAALLDRAAATPEMLKSLELLTALSRFAEGEHDEGRKTLAAWLERYGKEAGADKVRFLMGWSHLVSGERDKAAEWFEQVRTLHLDGEYAAKAEAFLDRLQPEPKPDTQTGKEAGDAF